MHTKFQDDWIKLLKSAWDRRADKVDYRRTISGQSEIIRYFFEIEAINQKNPSKMFLTYAYHQFA